MSTQSKPAQDTNQIERRNEEVAISARHLPEYAKHLRRIAIGRRAEVLPQRTHEARLLIAKVVIEEVFTELVEADLEQSQAVVALMTW